MQSQVNEQTNEDLHLDRLIIWIFNRTNPLQQALPMSGIGVDNSVCNSYGYSSKRYDE
ncbi:conjugal transfer protein TraS [Escherichia coli]